MIYGINDIKLKTIITVKVFQEMFLLFYNLFYIFFKVSSISELSIVLPITLVCIHSWRFNSLNFAFFNKFFFINL